MAKISGYKKWRIFSPVIIMIFILGHSAIGLASSDIKKFKMIEFKDIYYLSKYEIIDRAGIRSDGSDIIVDMDLLRKALIEQSLVNTFKIVDEGARLSVIIQEKKPVYLFGFRSGDDLQLFETDGNFGILSAGRIHAVNMPLVIINRDDIKRSSLSEGIRNLMTMIGNFKKGRLSGLLEEISEIDLTDPQTAEIRLKGRKTLFVMTPDFGNFLRLNDSVGYFDRIRYYPEEFKITSALGIIKKR